MLHRKQLLCITLESVLLTYANSSVHKAGNNLMAQFSGELKTTMQRKKRYLHIQKKKTTESSLFFTETEKYILCLADPIHELREDYYS